MRLARTEGAEISDMVKLPTPEHPEDGMAIMREYLDKHTDITEAAGGIAGVVRDNQLIHAPHLPAWDGYDLAGVFNEKFPLRLYNDTEIACLGEAKLGAGKGYGTVGYLAIGTGVGGARYADGAVTPHEPGHEVRVGSGRTLEEEISGSGLEMVYGAPANELPQSVYQERTESFAQGLLTLIDAWSPDIFVLNGSLMNEENGFRMGDIEAELKQMTERTLPPLVRAAFGDASGLYGAAA